MLKDKALANLRAGDALVALGLVDPAASRYYYALYEAAVHRLSQLGRAPGRIRSGAVKWDHSMVRNNIFLVRRRRADRVVCSKMRLLREAADYGADSVVEGELAALVPDVRTFVLEVTA